MLKICELIISHCVWCLKIVAGETKLKRWQYFSLPYIVWVAFIAFMSRIAIEALRENMDNGEV